MICDCPVCGKVFDVLWPHLWAYKRNSDYICSWKCLRVCEKPIEKRSDEFLARGVKKLNAAQQEEAVKCALAGGNPLKYLENCGSLNPSASWYAIKQKVKKNDPATYAKLPAKIERKDAVKKEPEVTVADAMQGMQDAADEFFGKFVPDEPEYLTDEETKRLAASWKICKPVMHSGLTASAWKGLFGRYSYDDKHDMIDYEGNDGEELSMKVESWQKFIGELKLAASLMGVEL